MCFNASENARLDSMLFYEKEALSKGFKQVAGIDEAGRGPLAGPVVAAACILPPSYYLSGLNDSKQLNAKFRRSLFESLLADSRIIYGVGIISSEEIDRVNIYEATKLAMYEAIRQLSVAPDYLLVDGMALNGFSIPSLKIIKGDQLSQSIAAASIIAKETRDLLMGNFHQQWPMYGFDQHKGYGTQKHMEALRQHGPCPIHRFTFKPVSFYKNSTAASAIK